MVEIRKRIRRLITKKTKESQLVEKQNKQHKHQHQNINFIGSFNQQNPKEAELNHQKPNTIQKQSSVQTLKTRANVPNHPQQTELNNSKFSLFLRFLYEILDDEKKFVKTLILVLVIGGVLCLLMDKAVPVIKQLWLLGVFKSSLFEMVRMLLGTGWVFG